MKIFGAALGVVVVGFSGSAAKAASPPVIAELKTPVAAATKFIAGGAIFACEDKQCIARAPMSGTNSVEACRAVVRHAGPVLSFGDAHRSLSAERLRDCNVDK